MNKFYNIYNDKEINDAMNNKYLLNFKYKLNDKIYISKKYGIIIRNLNEIENDILSESLILKICKILSLFKNTKQIFDDKKLQEIKSTYLKQFTDFNDQTIITYDLEGFEHDNLFDKIIIIIKDNINNIDSKNIENISKKIANQYLENCIVLYSEKEKSIYNLINRCTNYNNEDIDLFDKYDDFIFKYIELWNSLNFNQYNYFGIKVNNFTTKLDLIIDLFDLEKMEIFDECIKIFDSPIMVDIDDDVLFYFIINRFYSYYMDNNNRILLYFSLLELLLSHKPSCKNDSSISMQLSNNIIICSKKYNQIEISEKEIRELYNYRSLLIHGNFNKIHKALQKIKKFDFAKRLIVELEIEEFVEDDFFMVNLLRIRMLEIFSFIYKIYCIDKLYVEKLKMKRSRSCILDKIKYLFIGGKYE